MATPTGRITVVETVYHQLPGEPPQSVVSRFSRELQSVEQAFVRRMTVGSERKPVEYGWLSENNCGMLVLVNETRLRPTADDEEHKASTVTVYVGDDPLFLLPPGESMRIFPLDVLLLEARHGKEVTVTVHAFPR